MTNQAGSEYRHDIGGLRAFAVMGVILHLCGVALVGSGYAGVDVFFVISGFLIGGIVTRELTERSFSWRRFYARRARRILPALFLVILASLALGWGTMTPEQLRYFGGGAMSTLLFLSNVWFYNRIDYFNPGATEDPLIHTWSLAVEEQFYIILPVLLFLIWRFGPRVRVGVLVGLAVVSFAVAVTTGPDDPMAIFYLIHARAWELLAGVLAALGFARAQVLGRTGGILADLGLVLVLAGLFVVPHSALWPGPWTLLPVGGAVLLVLYGHRASVARWILRLPPVVGIGLVSYSAYLWHQPILGFLAILDRKPADWTGIGLVVLGTLALATLSWRFVEQPFRHGFATSRRGSLVLWLSGLAIAGFAIGGHVTEGYPTRVSPEVREMLAWSESFPSTIKQCIGGRKIDRLLDPATACRHGNPDNVTVAIWGDSHAAMLAKPLGDAIAADGLGLLELTMSSCLPIPGLINEGQANTPLCAEHNRRMLDYLSTPNEIKVVVMHAYWNSYVQRQDYANGLGDLVNDGFYAYPINASSDMTDEDRYAAIDGLLSDAIQRIVASGKRVILLYPLPDPGFNVPDRMARKLWQTGTVPETVSIPLPVFQSYSADTVAIFDSAVDQPGAIRLDLSTVLCDPMTGCDAVRDGQPLYFDGNHLSLAGSAIVIPPLAKAVLGLLRPRLDSRTTPMHHGREPRSLP